MLQSILFDRYLDDVALHHLIDALCKLSSEAMDIAYANKVRLVLYGHSQCIPVTVFLVLQKLCVELQCWHC